MAAALAFRRATLADRKFVIHSWADSYRLSHYAGLIPMLLYSQAYDNFLEAVLSREGINLTIAYRPGESPPDDVYGWACTEHGTPTPVDRRVNGRRVRTFETSAQPVVHYVYVKQPFRRLGIAGQLLARAGVDLSQPFVHTCKTATLARIQKAGKYQRITFDPLVARYPKNKPEKDENAAIETGLRGILEAD